MNNLTLLENDVNGLYRIEALKDFGDVKNGDLVAYAVCGEYNKEEHMTRAGFDYEKEVCPDCKRDGN